MIRKRKTPSRVVAVFDTETVTVEHSEKLSSIAVTFQLGWRGGADLTKEELRPCDCKIERTQEKLFSMFAPIVIHGAKNGYTPVIAVHNLAYDLRYLMNWLGDVFADGYQVTCCFKSSIKPLTVSIESHGRKLLTFWDTLTFSGMSLEKMGVQANCAKLVGSWDYAKTRNAKTPLTDDEKAYAIGDLLTLAAWLRWYASISPEVNTNALGHMILTKTSVVRYKTRNISSGLFKKCPYGRVSIWQEFTRTCKAELPKSETDYKLMIRATSAGWTFTAMRGAGVAFEHVKKRDATSMHPSHMVSHKYPLGFQMLDDPNKREFVFSTICGTSVEKVIRHWEQPFPYAFNARVRFTKIRPKANTVFERDGVMLHGTGLFRNYESRFADLDDERSNREFNFINDSGYNNAAIGATYAFGKLVYAEELVISLNEINAWVHAQVYDWDTCTVLEMSATGDFHIPPDHVFVSVATMLERKKLVKDLMSGAELEKPPWMPESAYNALCSEPDSDAAKDYYGLVKADLNSLYGMFATNEMRQSIAYIDGENTFDYEGMSGFDNMPAKPKAWYQFGMRVAAFSRLQQCVAMILLERGGAVSCMVNGDTDSLAFESFDYVTDSDIDEILLPMHTAIARSIDFCARTYHVKGKPYTGLGVYTVDCTPTLYCAVANKRYAYIDDKMHVKVASAGVPIRSVRAALEYELANGMPFNKAVIATLGYDVEFVGKISGTKARRIPEWGETLGESLTVTDWQGNAHVYEPDTCVGLALTDTSKILGQGFAGDYAICCENAGIMLMEPRHYEGRILESGDVEIIGKW